MKFAVMLFLLCAVQSWGNSRELLEERFEDYYTRQILLERERVARERGAAERSRERTQEEADYEQRRQQFVLERRREVKPDDTAHLREIEERRRQYEVTREDYVREQLRLRQLGREYTIPPEEELNLSPENL